MRAGTFLFWILYLTSWELSMGAWMWARQLLQLWHDMEGNLLGNRGRIRMRYMAEIRGGPWDGEIDARDICHRRCMLNFYGKGSFWCLIGHILSIIIYSVLGHSRSSVFLCWAHQWVQKFFYNKYLMSAIECLETRMSSSCKSVHAVRPGVVIFTWKNMVSTNRKCNTHFLTCHRDPKVKETWLELHIFSVKCIQFWMDDSRAFPTYKKQGSESRFWSRYLRERIQIQSHECSKILEGDPANWGK